MRDYLTIAEKIEDLSLKTSDKIIGMPLMIIGGILLIVFVYFGVSAINEIGFWDKVKRIAFSLIFLVLGGILGGFGVTKIYSHQNYNNQKVQEFLRKEGLESMNLKKFFNNISKVKQFGKNKIPDKYIKCRQITRYKKGCNSDYESYYNDLLNNYYNNQEIPKELFEQLEK